MALSRRESPRLTDEQSSTTSGRSRERLADTHGSATPRPPETVRKDFSANRPSSGVTLGVQFEGNSGEEEVDVLCGGAVNGGSSRVRNMACEGVDILC